ncbi:MULTISPECIES: lipopolysaccharide transport periplasmic protein LptA [Pseudoalteromonas]|uniref:Lipopolysaccharide transport periplasmic protein LptA n=1 Tax=Pseudoalteromonas undina TaxID=43660 RepID=A0ACC6R3I4_9GAMM|nr:MULTISPECIES: lipopolysaccharide transport periplasmic protein LptA [unclassified Pseudoalteromonas]KPZ56892.1 Lipopolysaccharide export system protein LptA precursor [Pseudoalteromonas sp. P1-25]KPZ59876.1 Lipopolysaccharide export system protein LptA precursor [Pseudoalteromonas sp. P1-13-1a]KPZ62071.1 Lipopolysaccharide export system protein LptA precursor [Pseudoalteromonas sp. P1-7a]
MTNKLTKILIIPSLMLAFSASAAEPAAQPPANQISISADRQEGQLKENVGIFEKNVEIVHGNRKITADRLEVHKREDLGDNKQLLIATGSPAYFEEKQDDGTVMSASANEVRYDVAKRFLTLVGDAEVAQAGQKINAKSITYDMQQQLISAEKDENSTDRVHTILVPVEANIKEKTGNEGQP